MKVSELVNQTLTKIEHSCCTGAESDDKESSFLKIAKIVARLGLGLLCAAVAPSIFLPFFLAGAAWAFYQVTQDKDIVEVSSANGGCTQLYLENLAGMRLPAEASFLFNTAIQLFHVIVCPLVFASYASATLGTFAGREVAVIYDRLKHEEV